MKKEKFNQIMCNVLAHENSEKLNKLTKVQREKFEKELKKEKDHHAKMELIKSILDKISAGVDLVAAEKAMLKKAYQDSISSGSGKMEGMNSISTSVLLNKRCAKNALIPGSICSSCYAMRYAGFRSALRRKLELNTLLYSYVVVPIEYLPTINDLYFRLESFGDLNNEIQVINYFNVCRKNQNTTFAQWSKNPDYIDAAINQMNQEKPGNIIIIYSSILKNVCNMGIFKKYGFIDKIFTVYTGDYITRENIEINCGARHCMGCLQCYKKNGITVINEKLK